MQSVHPAQQLSMDDIETFALSVAEFKGVIGKEHSSKRRDQKVQEAQYLLQAEAALVEVPALRMRTRMRMRMRTRMRMTPWPTGTKPLG